MDDDDMTIALADRADKNRLRVSRACDSCNVRKRRCDNAEPICGQCATVGATCTYEREVRKRGPPKGYVFTAPRRKRPEGGGGAARPRRRAGGARRRRSSTPDSGSGSGGEDYDAHGSSFSRSPKSLDTAVRGSRTPSRGTASPVSPPTDGLSALATGTLRQLAETLPPQDVVAALLDLYFHFVHPAHTVLHRATFLRNLSASPSAEPSSLLLVSVLGCAAAHASPERVPARYSARYFWDQAREHLSQALEGPATLDTVVALTHMVVMAARVHPERESMQYRYNSIALRLALELRLDADPSILAAEGAGSDFGWVESEVRRRAWWRVYLCELSSALSPDSPPSLRSPSLASVALPVPSAAFDAAPGPLPTPDAAPNPPFDPASLWSDGAVALPANMDHFGWSAVLMCAAGRWQDLAKRCRAAGVGLFDEEGSSPLARELAHLRARLDHLVDSSPVTHLQWSDDPPLLPQWDRGPPGHPPCVSLAHLSLLAHGALVLANSPADPDAAPADLAWFRHPAYVRAVTAAVEAARAAAALLSSPAARACAGFLPPSAAGWIARAARVCAVALRAEAAAPAQEPAADAIDFAAHALALVRALRAMAATWPSAAGEEAALRKRMRAILPAEVAAGLERALGPPASAAGAPAATASPFGSPSLDGSTLGSASAGPAAQAQAQARARHASAPGAGAAPLAVTMAATMAALPAGGWAQPAVMQHPGLVTVYPVQPGFVPVTAPGFVPVTAPGFAQPTWVAAPPAAAPQLLLSGAAMGLAELPVHGAISPAALDASARPSFAPSPRLLAQAVPMARAPSGGGQLLAVPIVGYPGQAGAPARQAFPVQLAPGGPAGPFLTGSATFSDNGSLTGSAFRPVGGGRPAASWRSVGSAGPPTPGEGLDGEVKDLLLWENFDGEGSVGGYVAEGQIKME